jgi:RNA polymerase sigma-70 factor (ECF subfamily)
VTPIRGQGGEQAEHADKTAAYETAAYETAEAVARRSYGKLVAFLAARTRDVAGSEDALSQAFAAALVEWPASGVPANPEAWLMTVAKRRQIDAGRRERRNQTLKETHAAPEMDLPTDIPDERLALMFACAHPSIDAGIRAPLILQTLLGFDAATIASAFLVSPATMSQRLVRAKNKIRDAGIPFGVPGRGELSERLDAVLEAIYAAFTEGWPDAEGADVGRRNLAEEALWLGRLAASLLPEEPEALGLLALMLHAEARRGARRTVEGEYVPLAEQDPELWDHRVIAEAEALLVRASRLGRIGRFQLEAAVQSAHAARRYTGVTDWWAVLSLYDALLAETGSMVVAINRAVVCAEVDGPTAALEELDRLAGDARLSEYQPYWAARAQVLRLIGDKEEAGAAYDRAIGLESDPAVRRFLQKRRGEIRS